MRGPLFAGVEGLYIFRLIVHVTFWVCLGLRFTPFALRVVSSSVETARGSAVLLFSGRLC